jgi:hypothetical protein
MLRTTLTLLLILSTKIAAVETCSRLAVINYQEVLVDTNSTEKGEGLRFHLEKDPLAKSYLDTYQEGTQIRWQNAAMGTLATSMMLGGIFTNDSSKKRTMLIGGATIMIINFLVAKTLDSANESNLIKAIEEYNKRNLPKIYFNPERDSSKSTGPGVSMAIEKSWSF